MKHTKAPWFVINGYIQAKEIEDDPLFNNTNDVDCICILPDWDNSWKDERLANAYLIAAAPELLEALEDFVSHSSAQVALPVQCERAEAAIAKTKGELNNE